MNSGTSLVEVDLLRAGFHTVAAPLDCTPHRGEWDYLVSVSRTSRHHAFETYRRTVRERLPRVAIPLADPDPDVVLDLQSVLDRCYDNGAYARLLDYSSDAPIPFRDRDREWARELLQTITAPA